MTKKVVTEQKTKEAPRSNFASFTEQMKVAKEVQATHKEALAKLAKS
jgi:hypothetical protein